jgi:hypothetical protein
VAISELRVSVGRKPLPGDLARRTWLWLTLATMAAGFFVARNMW